MEKTRTIKTTIITILLVLALTVSGCLNQITSSETNGSKEPTEQVFCTEDARVCPDGSAVGRDPNNNCNFFDCPLESKVDVKFRSYAANSIEQCAATTFICDVEGTKAFFDQSGCGCEAVEPKKYVSEDLEQCQLIKYMCTENRVPFTDEVGCGCEFSWEEAKARNYLSRDVEECQRMDYICKDGTKSFVDETGCGCEKDNSQPTDGKVQAIDCPETRTQACTKEYMPVCGQVQVECIQAPCDPVKQTFGNKCEACANDRTISYFQGACEDENLAGGTVLAGTNEEQCTNMGGSWTGFDCEGLDANQCQEIGGTFNECASACRNNPDAEICTMQCVQVCTFN